MQRWLHTTWPAVLVLASTTLGLQGALEIWTVSVLADLVFIIGTVAVGVGVYFLAKRHGAVALAGSVLAAFLGNWLVYALSWSAVVSADEDTWGFGSGEIFTLVLQVGWMGLIAASAVPIIVARFEPKWFPETGAEASRDDTDPELESIHDAA